MVEWEWGPDGKGNWTEGARERTRTGFRFEHAPRQIQSGTPSLAVDPGWVLPAHPSADKPSAATTGRWPRAVTHRQDVTPGQNGQLRCHIAPQIRRGVGGPHVYETAHQSSQRSSLPADMPSRPDSSSLSHIIPSPSVHDPDRPRSLCVCHSIPDDFPSCTTT